MTRDDALTSLEKGLIEFRRTLATVQVAKIPAEPIGDIVDTKAVLEATAIADKDYDEIERNRRRAETQNIVENNRDKRINRKLRWRYASWVFCYLVCYSVFVGIVVLMSGFKIWFDLPPSVLDFLVGSTAAAAIGLVYAVTSGLFGSASK